MAKIGIVPSSAFQEVRFRPLSASAYIDPTGPVDCQIASVRRSRLRIEERLKLLLAERNRLAAEAEARGLEVPPLSEGGSA